MFNNQDEQHDIQALLKSVINRSLRDLRVASLGLLTGKDETGLYTVQLFPLLRNEKQVNIKCLTMDGVTFKEEDYGTKVVTVVFLDRDTALSYLQQNYSQVLQTEIFHSVSYGVIISQDASGGGGGGFDYNDATNKPQVNGVTLTGNKTTSELGIDLSQFITQTQADNRYQPITHLYRYFIELGDFHRSDIGSIQGWVTFEWTTSLPPTTFDVVLDEYDEVVSFSSQKLKDKLIEVSTSPREYPNKFMRLASGQLWGGHNSRVVRLDRCKLVNGTFGIHVIGYGDEPLTNGFDLQSDGMSLYACNKLF